MLLPSVLLVAAPIATDLDPPPPDPTSPAQTINRSVAGLSLGLGALAVGTLSGYLAGIAIADRGDDLWGPVGAVLGFGVGAGAYPLAVATGSRAFAGRGSVAGAYAGAVAGYLAAAGVYALMQANLSELNEVTVTGGVILTAGLALAGPVVGSEIGVRRRIRDEGEARQRLTLMPRVLPVATRGRDRPTLALGLGGHF